MALFEGTWVAPSLGGEIVKMRWLLIACISCGLIQKPLISFAWDVQVFTNTLVDVHKANASRQLLGGTAILLRQVFAATAQDVVGRRALDLAARGGRWTCRSLQALLRELQGLDPADASKRRGRMSQFSGPPWLSNLLSDSSHLEQFSAAADAVGNLLHAPVLAGGSKMFSAACSELKGPAKLPLLGAYSVPHLMRACVVARRVIDGAVIDVSGDAWLHDLRTMHRERTADVFDTLGVHSLDDALVMQRSVMGVVKTFYSTRTVAKYSGMSLVDLPCQACELIGVLNFVKKHLSTHACGGRGDPARWILERLPGDDAGIKALSKQLKVSRERVEGKGNGLDLQCAAAVTKSWLGMDPEPLVAKSFWRCTRAGGAGIPFTLPRVKCLSCQGPLTNSVFRGYDSWCQACRLTHRLELDATRSAKRRAVASSSGVPGIHAGGATA